MQNKIYIIFFFVLLWLPAKSQTLKGKINTVDNKIVSNANIIVKDSANAIGVKEFVIARNGSYTITLQKNYQNIFVEINAIGYTKENYTIKNTQKNQVYENDFLLNKDRVIDIAEIKIVNKRKPYTEANDTISFNVSSYKDGSDRKIQDIIRKLPGMEVNDDTGEIKFKGKPIETVQIEGDDLFSGNYTTGTKNINVDMIEQVQAIENFSANKLLKGLETDGRVALNLKLKKNITDISGSVNTALGSFEEKNLATDSDVNFLTISSKIKSFGTLSFNNIATNYAPFDYFGNFVSNTESENNSFKARKIIGEFSFVNVLDNNRTVLNNTLFANYNILLKKSQRTNFKSNLYFVKDKISALNNTESKNTIDNQTFETSEKNNITKQPLFFRADFIIKHFDSAKSSIDYDFIISYEKIGSESNLLQNTNTFFKTTLDSKNIFFKSKFQYTKRISDSKALQIMSYQTLSDLDQIFLRTPQNIDLNFTNAQQTIQSKKMFFDVKAILIGKVKKAKYKSNLGFEYLKLPLNSALVDLNANSQLLSSNAVDYSKSVLFSKNSLDYDWAYLRIFSNLNFALLSQYLDSRKTTDLIVEPDVNLSYKFSRISSINFGMGLKVNSTDEQYRFRNDILVSNRTTIKNNPSLDLQKISSANINYNLYDLSKQFQSIIGVSYSENKGGFFNNVNIDSNNTRLSYFFLNEKFNTTNFNFMIEKYLPFIESTIRLKTNYTTLTYKNFVNNSDIRENISEISSYEFFMKSAFDGVLNFENILKLNNFQTKNADNQVFRNQNINNAFKILIKPSKKLFSNIAFDYFKTANRSTYSFIDFFINYIPSDKRFTYSISGQNLLNNTDFREINISDFYTNSFSSNIIPRALLFKINYSF